MNIKDYGFNYDAHSDSISGTPARITAVHKGRFGIVSDFGEGIAETGVEDEDEKEFVLMLKCIL